ncbi:RCD1-SRO-TAF4 (RST) plant domain [Musa troglodytarum]|uniref:RCD1-SRO-TAF4 (RST) plant domain n=1 Tax=Musa troglodytarum TaxID=320322 RepID=A0A9E7GEX0_9LILI|nr:RCD1-SRO-TAF4 (RST) plant domain [Musa troglodytarum]
MDRSNPRFSNGTTSAADVEPARTDMASAAILFRRSSSLMIREFKKYKMSASPSRFLFFRDGSWADFPPAVFDALREGFVAGKTAFELPVEGCPYLFDVLEMLQVDLETGTANSIAWIDVRGRCFFPAAGVDERRISALPNPEPEIECNPLGFWEEQSGDSSDETSTISSLDQPRWPGVEAVRDGDKYFKIVEKLFLSGFQRFVPNTIVTSIHKCSQSGPRRASRLKAFRMHVEMTKAARGDANVRFGWYGASATELATIVAHGFGQPDNRHLASGAGGIGVHFSEPHSPYLSSLSTDADASGELHMVLCRVIVGRPEKVEEGSGQYLPSSEEFDSGVDDLAHPTWYVVWSTHMNTHILPESIVSYKPSTKQPQGPPKSVNSARNSATDLLIPRLLAELGRCLPASLTGPLQMMYKQYTGRKISKQTFIRSIRSVAGDTVLISTIKRMRGY